MLTKGGSPVSRTKGSDNLYAYIIEVSCSWVGFQSRSVTVTPVSSSQANPSSLRELKEVLWASRRRVKATFTLVREKWLPLPHHTDLILAVAQVQP